MSGPMSSRMSKCRASEASPPVRSKAMMSPEASDFAWIFVVKPPRERPSACSSCPFCPGRRHMSAHAGEVEHLKDMRRRTHRCERIEEGLEDAGLAQAIEAFPHAVPRTEAL